MKTEIVRAFEEVYGAESDAIYRFCLVRVSGKDQALDIMQETFLRLWQNMLAEKNIANKKAFLFTIAHNLVIDWYRKKKSLSLENLGLTGKEERYALPEGLVVSNLEAGVEARYLLEKINELSPTYRTAVYLHFVEDLGPQEIGKILGISMNAASVRVNRGVKELRQKAGYEES